jgi:uncharacterized protein YndB with AHSA1/START domain
MEDDMSNEHQIDPVRRSVEVGCSVAEAFRLFTEDIDSWWPLATHSIGQDDAESCYFEGREGGRIFETHSDGSVHLWGTVTAWYPPERVVFTWHPGREVSTAQEVELRFSEIQGGTRVELEHRGWESLGEKAQRTRASYETGWVPVLERYVARCS